MKAVRLTPFLQSLVLGGRGAVTGVMGGKRWKRNQILALKLESSDQSEISRNSGFKTQRNSGRRFS
jgi:hypothetical protein